MAGGILPNQGSDPDLQSRFLNSRPPQKPSLRKIFKVYPCYWASFSECIPAGMPLNKHHKETE